MTTRDQRPAAGGDSDWLTLGQAAKFLGVAQSTIRKWSDVGRVPAFYTPGGHRRYKRGDLEAFLLDLGDATRVTAVISKKFNAVELYGLRELMVLRDIGRIERYEKEWNRLHAADPPPKPAPRLILEVKK